MVGTFLRDDFLNKDSFTNNDCVYHDFGRKDDSGRWIKFGDFAIGLTALTLMGFTSDGRESVS